MADLYPSPQRSPMRRRQTPITIDLLDDDDSDDQPPVSFGSTADYPFEVAKITELSRQQHEENFPPPDTLLKLAAAVKELEEEEQQSHEDQDAEDSAPEDVHDESDFSQARWTVLSESRRQLFELEKQSKVERAQRSLQVLRDGAKAYEEKKQQAKAALARAQADRERKRPLSQAEIDMVEHILFEGHDHEAIVDDIQRNDLRTIAPGEWLNDKIMQSYLALIPRRAEENPHLQYPRCHAFGTHFYTLLSKSGRGYDYSRVKSWTRKVDLFAKDVVIVPIHLGNHWTMAIIHPQRLHIDYYDSLGGRHRGIELLKRYLQDEHMNKKQRPLEGQVTHTFHDDIPQQQNGYDCGVFACHFAECAGRGSDIDFTQKDMSYFRQRMILEIINKKLAL